LLPGIDELAFQHHHRFFFEIQALAGVIGDTGETEADVELPLLNFFEVF
jgi:hypothetical protein